MRRLLLGSMTALALVASPLVVHAQGNPPPPPPPADAPSADYSMTAEQQASFDAWTAEEQANYAALEAAQKQYFWTLPPDRQRGYWMLSPDQRTQIYNMTPEQRELAWKSVSAQLAGMAPATPATQANPPGQGMPTDTVPEPKSAAEPVPPSMPADESYQGGPYKGALTPPPPAAKDYPVCSKTVKDGCRNPGGK